MFEKKIIAAPVQIGASVVFPVLRDGRLAEGGQIFLLFSEHKHRLGCLHLRRGSC